ncbi:MAG: hypothetical protein EOP50_21930 [Sphingobacteriales bacterium]|nr:MAG: hypothetical protein EOP50_21930 [Sphingobacteriales bacterium]
MPYTVEWRLRLPSGTYDVKPFYPDGEFDARQTTANVYWEGPVRVTGSAEGQGFLEMSGYDRLDALRQMLEYAKEYRDKESSFTIQWMARGERELQTSYFRASNVYNALDKLYYGRDVNTITVFSVVLNPIA